MTKQTQEQRIEKHLLQPGATLTPLEALQTFGCFRLAAVMHRLKDRHTIKTEIVVENGKRFARYTIEQAGKQLPLEVPRPPDDAAEEQSEEEARERMATQ